MDEWATHLPVLAACVANTNGSVMELGCGDYSTPVLHYMCGDKRKLVSADYSREWCEKFKVYASDTHTILHVTDWDSFSLIDQHWDVVLVDHSPGERRNTDIIRMAKKVTYLVVHDAQALCYKYSEVIPRFQYVYTFDRYPTHTMVLSNFCDPKEVIR